MENNKTNRRDAPTGRLYNKNNNPKFRNQYRIKSVRLPDYDYRQNGAYFITICTKNREHFFGEITNNQMQLSEIGKIIADEWQKTAKIRNNIQLGEWVIMPNHFHGIIIIQNDFVETPRRGVSTNSWKSGCLGAIINQFKSICTKRLRMLEPRFSWQSRFYDHVIRNEKDYNAIVEYIIFNPQNWGNDENFI